MVNKTFYSKPRRLEKLTKAELVELVFDLINSFRLVSNPKETAHFLQDLLTAKEIKNLSKRFPESAKCNSLRSKNCVA